MKKVLLEFFRGGLFWLMTIAVIDYIMQFWFSLKLQVIRNIVIEMIVAEFLLWLCLPIDYH